ncbi:MAG TPA: BT_3928 family protein, partial [Flavisolibacter sp.]|nr:BT_3928 family protein [Flavisolibacter sp.]
MRIAVNSVRFFVGVLFIISGMVKANDPLGLSYKMQEFFEVWNASLTTSGFFAKNVLISFFSFLHSYSLSLSLLMISLEVLAGIALILGWKRRFVLNLLLVLMLFFTFLTAYAYWSGKFKNCGCFGDCLPITPLTSFIKDIVLLVMIILLLIQQRFIEPLFKSTAIGMAMLISFVGILFFQWYVLNYLPVVDCLPYKEGNNIVEKMKIPANAVQDSFAIKFVYQKDGKQFEFAPEELPSDLNNYKFVDRIQKLVRKGNAEAPIKGFSLIGSTGADSTEIILNQPVCLILF